MWRNYLTVGIRSLAKNRAYAAINILGLAIGMAACLMILLFVRYEFSYDKWLPGAENAYQLQSWYKSRETGEEDKLQMTALHRGQACDEGLPAGRARSLRFHDRTGPDPQRRSGDAQRTSFSLDGNLLDVLKLPLAQGRPQRAQRGRNRGHDPVRSDQASRHR